ncbi:hypothetical protein PYCCODRAFT_1427819 [Trametes coccinea BRFM310]|uniref:Uncharacterized protein n=1 Tax=Trametes coccinea (strain BRFM310) TaxID=1353009 RepID=A0A1Y2IBC6_TRAC3|nr:hypothetical protein PYCCODRAFT_1427819 [Trametes coccinea BRFM310]
MYLRFAVAFHLLLAIVDFARTDPVEGLGVALDRPSNEIPLLPRSKFSSSRSTQLWLSWIFFGVCFGFRSLYSAICEVCTSSSRCYDYRERLESVINTFICDGRGTNDEDKSYLCDSLGGHEETLPCSRRSSDTLVSSPSLGLCSGCDENNTSLDSGTFQDTLTLHAGDIAHLGDYLARKRGMFAWRVYPLSNLSVDSLGSAETNIMQRIDAFFKPVGRSVHYVELVLEWTPSAGADFSFLVFPDALTSPRTSSACAKQRNPHVVGVRVHAFRARVCDQRFKTRAELLLNKLGLGSLWTCSWNWDTQLGKAFDAATGFKHMRDALVVERWHESVRAYWEAAGRTAEDIARWESEVTDYGWTSDDDSDDSSSGWTDESRGCYSSSESSDADSDGRLESGDDDCKDVRLDDTEPFTAKLAPSHSTPLTTACDEDVCGEPEEVVLYPRSQSAPPVDEEELILYHIPHTPLAVYPPIFRPSTHHDPLAHLRPIYAPIPTYAPRVIPDHGVNSANQDPFAFNPTCEGEAYPSYSPPASPVPYNPPSAVTAERQVILHSRGVTVAPTGGADSFIQLTYRLLVEHQQGSTNQARCLIEVTSTLASCAPCEPCNPTPVANLMSSDATARLAQVHAHAPHEDDDGQPRRKTRRAGRKLTARRQRQRVDTGQKANALAAELKAEVAAAAREAGVRLVDVAVYVNHPVPRADLPLALRL